jgi:hypothetical protein
LCEELARAATTPQEKEKITKYSTIRSCSATNNKSHLLRRHALSHDSPQVKAKIEEVEAQARATAGGNTVCESFSTPESEARFYDYMLYFARALYECEDPLFRQTHPHAPASAKTPRDKLIKHSAVRVSQALAKSRNTTVTLAIDGGTIWSKYLCQKTWMLPAMPFWSARQHKETGTMCERILKYEDGVAH